MYFLLFSTGWSIWSRNTLCWYQKKVPPPYLIIYNKSQIKAKSKKSVLYKMDHCTLYKVRSVAGNECLSAVSLSIHRFNQQEYGLCRWTSLNRKHRQWSNFTQVAIMNRWIDQTRSSLPPSFPPRFGFPSASKALELKHASARGGFLLSGEWSHP